MAKSIMHNKRDGTCYLCVLLNGDYETRTGLHEHHVISGTASRQLSERYGIKVYLCVQHHIFGPAAVHNNPNIRSILQKKAQETFEKKYSHEKWMDVFGKNYL